MPNSIPFTEPGLVQDIIISGLADFQEIEPGIFRATLYVESRSSLDHSKERQVVAKLIVSAAAANMINSQIRAILHLDANASKPDLPAVVYQ